MSKVLLAAIDRLKKRWDRLRSNDPFEHDLDLASLDYIRNELVESPRRSLASIIANNDDELQYTAAHLLAEVGDTKPVTKKSFTVPSTR